MGQSTKNMLVTGATGNIGTALLDLLDKQAVSCIAGARDVNGYKAAHPGRDAVRLDFNDPSSFLPALKRADSVFLLRPPAVARVRHTLNRFIDEAQKVGTRHIVFSSVIGAENNMLLPHHWVERHLRDSGINHTILRPTFFANNLGGDYRDDIRMDRRIYLPSGDARVAFIDARDIAAVVAKIAQNPVAHSGKAYALTGSVTYSFSEVAAILSAALNTHISYHPASILGYVKHLFSRRLPLAKIAIQTLIHVDLRRGTASTIDPTLSRLLGRPSLSMFDYVRDHLEVWSDEPAPSARTANSLCE